MSAALLLMIKKEDKIFSASFTDNISVLSKTFFSFLIQFMFTNPKSVYFILKVSWI